MFVVPAQQNPSADFSDGPSWRALPVGAKKRIAFHADLATRRALGMTNHEMRCLVEHSTTHLMIRRNAALRWLRADSGRFENLQSLSFGKTVHIQRMNEIRASIHSIDLRGCHVVEEMAIDDLRTRRWTSMKLAYWREIGTCKVLSGIFLLSKSGLTCLSIDNQPIRYAGTLTLAKIKSLEKLSLSRCSIPNNGAELLATLPCLKKMVIDNNALAYSGALALLTNTSLTSLSIATNKLSSDGAEQAFWNAVSQHSLLTSLNISENRLGPDVAKFLARNTSIKALQIAKNHLGDDGVSQLAEMRNLVELDAADNKVGSTGVLAVVSNSTITSLNFSDNAIKSVDVNALLARGTVRSLILRDCCLSEGDLTQLWESKSLTKLDVGGNFTSKQIITAFSKPVSPMLRSFSIALGPSLSADAAAMYVPNGFMRTGLKVDFDCEFPFKSVERVKPKMLNLEQLRAISHAGNFRYFRGLGLSGAGFGQGNLALLPGSLEWLSLGRSGSLTASDLEPLATLPRLTHLHLFDTTINKSVAIFLTQLPALRWLYLRGVPLDSETYQVLERARLKLEIDIDPSGMHEAFAPWLAFLSQRA